MAAPGQWKPESIKTILEHIKPEKRLSIRYRCPSLKQMDQVTPTKIKYLYLHSKWIQINSTTYKIGLLRHYTDGIAPYRIRKENGEGGVIYDLPPYGEPDLSPLEKEFMGVGDHEAEEQRLMVERLKYIDEQLKPTQQWLHPIINPEMTKERNDILQKQKCYNERLAASAQRFTPRVELTISTKHTNNEETKIYGEKVVYDREMKRYFEYAAKKLLIDRKLRVKTMVVDHKFEKWNMEYILTVRCLTVKHLKIWLHVSRILFYIKGWLVNEDVPLVSLKLCQETEYNHPLIENAKMLSIDGVSKEKVLLELKNPKVQRNDLHRFTFEQAARLIHHFKVRGSLLGRQYLIILADQKAIDRMCDYIRKLPNARNGILHGEKESNNLSCINFPISANLELNIFSTPNTTLEHRSIRNDKTTLHHCTKYNLNFKVYRRGYAKLT